MSIIHLTDLHTHYDETVYESHRRETLLTQQKNGVCAIVNSGSDVPSSQRSVALAAEYDFVWASVGVFPLSAYTVPEGWLAEIESLAKQPRVVAIGEIGLDYRLPDTDAEKQKAVFHPQLQLARRLGLPVVIHDITYPDAGELIALVKEMPIELLLLETDCPFLPTQRYEGKPATSDMLDEVVEIIARTRGDITPQEVAEVAKQNAERFLSVEF